MTINIQIWYSVCKENLQCKETHIKNNKLEKNQWLWYLHLRRKQFPDANKSNNAFNLFFEGSKEEKDIVSFQNDREVDQKFKIKSTNNK